MTTQELSLSDAIQIAMEAEKKAAALYTDAVDQTSNPLGKRLFKKLAEMEQYHYDKLLDLATSLEEKGVFINYEAQVLPFSAEGEGKSLPEPQKMSMMKIITVAQEIEQQAETKYAQLATQTADPDGKAMFEQLAKEEHDHYRLLSQVYWNLNNHGVWSWPTK